jgi:aspartate-semialdehyde dehydrogenase
MMGHEFHFRDKIPVGILGATGMVGQRFIELLANHPWFEIVCLTASEKSANKPYGQAVNWLMGSKLPEKIANLIVLPSIPNLSCSLVFSSLDATVAGEIESDFVKNGYIVVTNARNHRMNSQVPLLVPEVNGGHLELLKTQNLFNGTGKIVTNPNCSTIGLTLALKPLHDLFGIEAVHVVTMQAISGAGYPGVASLDILDNVIPFISGEEKKMETEPLKILGSYHENQIVNSDIKISAQCNRVAVSDGHTMCVSVKLKNKPTKSEMIEAFHSFRGLPQDYFLPSAPEKPIHYFEEDNYPQPKKHRNVDKGMAASVGRLRECPLFDYKFTVLTHNTIRGAAGGAILNAELMAKTGYIHW